MVQRKNYPASRNCEISLATERLNDGWAVVASIVHHTPDAARVIDLPVPTERFATEADAEGFGLTMAREYIEQNMPEAA